MGKKLEFAIGVLNGVVGDYLAETGNGLATPMAFFHQGAPVPIEKAALARAYPQASSRVVVLAHGLMVTEDVWELPDGGGDYGAFLARDLGYTPLYLRYNTGLAIPDNGATLARMLETLLDAYPVPIEELLFIGYSMGGLVVRSACHVAGLEGHRWLSSVRRALYVGTPHLGAPMERVGRVVARLLHSVDDPYTRLVASIANLRSEGLQDLGDADLRHEDRARRAGGVSLRDLRHPVPLLPGIEHYLIAGTLSSTAWLADLFGDAVVPLPSATNDPRIPGEASLLRPEHVKILPSLDHLSIAHHPEVYAQIRAWCEETR